MKHVFINVVLFLAFAITLGFAVDSSEDGDKYVL